MITGVRFKEYGELIFLQPQIGKLLPAGSVDPNSLSWLDIFSKEQINITNSERMQPMKMTRKFLENWERKVLDEMKFDHKFRENLLKIDFDVPSSYTFCLGKMRSGYDHTSVVTGEYNLFFVNF